MFWGFFLSFPFVYISEQFPPPPPTKYACPKWRSCEQVDTPRTFFRIPQKCPMNPFWYMCASPTPVRDQFQAGGPPLSPASSPPAAYPSRPLASSSPAQHPGHLWGHGHGGQHVASAYRPTTWATWLPPLGVRCGQTGLTLFGRPSQGWSYLEHCDVTGGRGIKA